MYPTIDEDVKRCRASTFPFGVLFRDLPKKIAIVAIMHLHCDPDYWKSR
jgi:toxin ParE1/3/4